MTHNDATHLAATDSLVRHQALEHLLELPVLGINTHFDTNSRPILAIVEQAFGGWRCLDPSHHDQSEGVHVRIIAYEGPEDTSEHGPVRHYSPDATRLLVHSTGCVGVSDPAHRDAIAYVSVALANEDTDFREAILEALTFALLSHFDRHPIHAAAVAANGRAVLLAGPSGTGKSTLASLAHAEGMKVMGEDHVWVQRSPVLRVWGAPGYARLVSDTAADGAAKSVVAWDDARSDPACYVADGATVCVLERGNASELTRIDKAAVVDALTRQVDPGFDRFPDRHDAVVAALAAQGGWRLTLSNDPQDAVPHLRAMLDAR